MGSIYWQLNYCWPAPTWSSIDYYGNWKALQYRAKEDFKDITVLEKTQKIGKETYFLVSDSPDTLTSDVKYEVFNLLGKKISTETKKIKVYNGLKLQLFKQNLTPIFFKSNYLVRFEWKDLKGQICNREFVHIGNKSMYKKSLRANFNVELTNIDTINKTAILKVKTIAFLTDFWVTSSKKGVYFENNFVSLLPGTKEFLFHFETIPTLNDFTFKWR
jgi:beta-mannosidase